MRSRTLQLPRTTSSRRSDFHFCKLIYDMVPLSGTGFDLRGRCFMPGASVTLEQLRPNADYPEVPIVLEATQLDLSLIHISEPTRPY